MPQKKPLKQQVKHQTKKAVCHVHDHVVPCERNDYHPYLLKHHVLLGYSFIFILLKALALTVSVALPSTTIHALTMTPPNVVTLVNSTREHSGIPDLTVNSTLAAAAQARANDMAAEGYFSHTSPSGKTAWTFIKAQGYAYVHAGENLAVHYTSAEETLEGWMLSPSHKKNIMNSDYTETGVGVSQGMFEGYQTTFVVQFFGKPQVLAQAPSLAEPLAPLPSNQQEPKPAPTSAPELQSDPAPDPPPAPETLLQEAMIEHPEDSEDLSVQATIIPKKDEVIIQVPIAEAAHASVQLQDTSAALLKEEGTDVYSGSIRYAGSTFGYDGEQLYLTIVDKEQNASTTAIATIAPESRFEEVIASTPFPDHEVKLFGVFSVHSLQDTVRRTYIYFMIALGAILLLNVFRKLQTRRTTIIAHALAVMGLAAVLALL